MALYKSRSVRLDWREEGNDIPNKGSVGAERRGRGKQRDARRKRTDRPIWKTKCRFEIPPPFPSDGRGWKRRMNFRKLTDTRALASHMNDD